MSHIKIEVFNRSQFLKSGRIKKHPQPEYSRIIGDTGEIKIEDRTSFYKETAKGLKNEYTDFKSPYIFTHIQAKSIKTGEPVYIYEEVGLGGDRTFQTTPKLLLDLLNN